MRNGSPATRRASSEHLGASNRGKAAKSRNRAIAEERSAEELITLQRFRTIFASARRFDADVRHTAGLPGSLLWALAEISRGTEPSVNELAERMALHQTTASNLVNALVTRKLIRRARGRADQRVVNLHISALGVRVLQRAPGPHAGLLVDALRRLAPDQLRRLCAGLTALIKVMGAGTSRAAGETLLGE